MSLLLESLKKAALEKQKKEKGYSSQTEKSEKSVAAESHKQENTEFKVEEPVVFDSDEFEFIAEPDQSTEVSELFVQEIEKPEIRQEENKVEGSQSENSKPENLNSEESRVDVKTPEIKEPEEIREEKPAIEPSRSNQKPAEVKSHPIKDSRIPGFTPESGKAALAALLEKNKKIEKSSKTRSIYMIALLLFTGVGTLGGYYYFLMDSNSTLSSTNQMQLYSHGSNQSVLNGNAANETALIETTTTENISSESIGDVVLTDTQEPVSIPVTETNADSELASTESQARINKSVEKAQVNRPLDDGSVTPPVAEKPIQNSRSPVSNSKPVTVNSQPIAANSQPIESYIQSQPAVEDAIAQQVSAAYQAYQQGQWTEAQVLYQKVLMLDTYNRDALLGAAAVAIRQGKPQEALGYYQQQLERDPQDEYAISGIMALGLDANKGALLSEIDRRLQEKPTNVHLLFLKASILAGQQQWSAAQQTFFEAWNHDKNNADIVYNLAICLDRLNQPREAIHFYQMALSLKTASSNFSTASVEKRLARLTEATQ